MRFNSQVAIYNKVLRPLMCFFEKNFATAFTPAGIFVPFFNFEIFFSRRAVAFLRTSVRVSNQNNSLVLYQIRSLLVHWLPTSDPLVGH